MFKSVGKRVSRKLTYMLVVGLIAGLMVGGSALADTPDAIEQLPGAGWWTGVQLQNVGTGADAQVNIQSFIAGTSDPAIVKTISIPTNAARTLLPSDLTLPPGFQGSAVVSSDKPLNAIVNIVNLLVPNTGNGTPGGTASAQYQGVNNPATELRFPLVKRNRFGKTTTFYIQNAGSESTTARATFVIAAGDGITPGSPQTYSFTTPSILPGRMVILTPLMAGVPNNALGSLTVTSDTVQQLAGVVSEHGSENPAKALLSTRGFTPADYDTMVYAPTIKNRSFNLFTGLQVQNVSAAPIRIDVTYRGVARSCVGQTYTNFAENVQPGASFTFVHLPGAPGNTMPLDCVASATVIATGNIVAIVNEEFASDFLAGGGNGGRQESTVYSAFAAQSATRNLSAPLYKENAFNKGTGLMVQNVGDEPTAITATFVGSNTGNTYTTRPQTIQPGASFNFIGLAQRPELFDGTPIPSNIAGGQGNFGVSVTSSSQPIVSIANEATFPFGAGKSPLEQDTANYEAFNRPTP